MTALPPRLIDGDLADLTAWRRATHAAPELSGEEAETAARVAAALALLQPSRLLTGLGGHGVAAVWDAPAPGPRVLLRCELDALPILERGAPPHRSRRPGIAHLCGHDGHMAILLGAARLIAREPPARGSIVLLFQPAEEDGAGATRVRADPAYDAIRPDWAFALHNYPGMELGAVALAAGPAFCGSRGLRARFTGRTAHASEPEKGTSPAPALARLLHALPALGGGVLGRDPDFALATVTHARLGEPTFGVAPGEAVLHVTLRALAGARMAQLLADAEREIGEAATAAGVSVELDHEDVFPTTANDPRAVAIAASALDRLGLQHDAGPLPLRPSEDFGHFGADAAAAILLLGAGSASPALHNPDYDFPDALICPGAQIMAALARSALLTNPRR